MLIIKRSVLLLALVFSFSAARSQAYLIGLSQTEIRSVLSKNKQIYLRESKVQNDSMVVDNYRDTLTNDDKNYMYVRGICRMFFSVSDKSGYLNYVQRLNKTGIKIGDATWIDQTNTYKITLKTFPDNPYFSAEYTKL